MLSILLALTPDFYIRAADHFQIKTISSFLNVPASELPAQSDALIAFLNSSSQWHHFCSQKNYKWCDDLKDLGLEPQTVVHSTRSYIQLKARPTASDIKKYQSHAFADLIQSSARLSPQEIESLSKSLLRSTGCPQNLSAVMLRRLEGLLPARDISKLMESLYLKANLCLKPSDPGFEVTHFRQALLRKIWGKKRGALISIRKATETKHPQELSRILYWAGRISNENSEKEKLWDLVIQKRPMTFHALLISEARGTDLIEQFQKEPFVKTKPSFKKDDSLAKSLFWLKAILLRQGHEAAVHVATKILATFRNHLDLESLSYLTEIISIAEIPFQLRVLGRMSIEVPSLLGESTLRAMYPVPYFDVIDRYSPNIDSYLLMGLVRQESAFNPKAISRANARGLFQVLPGTASMVDRSSAKNLFDVKKNARVGVQYFSNLYERYNDTELALAAYNAGPNRIDKWKVRYETEEKILFLDLIPYPETRNYVSSILRNNYWYLRLHGAGSDGKEQPPLSPIRSKIVERLLSSPKSNLISSDKTIPIAHPRYNEASMIESSE